MIKYDPNRKNIYIRWLLIRVGLMVYDILAVSAAYFFALMVRFYVNNEFHAMAVKYIPAFLQFAPFYAVCCLVVFAGCGLYNSLWKYAGMHDLNRIAVSGFMTCAIQVVGTLLFVRRMPVSYYVLGAVFQLALITASRFSYRVLLIEARHFFRYREHLLNTMIVGTGESSRTLLKYLERDDSSIARPVCVVDFANAEICGTMAGVPVIGGVEQIGQAVKKYNVDRIVLADSVMPIHICKEVREIAREAGVGVQAFSEYFQSVPSKIPVKILMEHTKGPVELLIDGEKSMYQSPEQVMAALNGKYIVTSVCAEDGILQVSLTKDLLQPNDTHAEWVQKYRKETGEDVSFF